MFASLVPAVRSIIFPTWLAVGFVVPFSALAQSDPLPSWNDGGGQGARALPASSITPMPSANTPAIGKSKIGKFDKALDEASVRNWTVVDMKLDWKTVFAFEKRGEKR